MGKRKRNKNKKDTEEKMTFSEKEVYLKRRLPVKNIIFLIILVFIQVGLILLAFNLPDASPKDIINDYKIIVEPKTDGTLDLDYSFNWTAVDSFEELRWVEIGMPNENYTVDESSLSDNINGFEKYSYNGKVTLRLFFEESYIDGETFDFGFTVNQKSMLCRNDGGYFYEFVPSWFNSVPVKSFCISWKNSENIKYAEYDYLKDGYINLSGELPCGEYIKINVSYNDAFFDEAAAVTAYTPFDPGGVYNELAAEKSAPMFILIMFVVVFGLIELHSIDSLVSYVRGRGFLRSNGQYVHLYGGLNPVQKHISMVNARRTFGTTGRGGYYRSGGGFTSGGCACACACACAGGGRAGCSQKDTSSVSKIYSENE